MENYQIDALGSLTPEDIDAIQKQRDTEARDFLEEHREILIKALGPKGFEALCKLYTNTMKKQSFLFNGPRKALGQRQPEAIYNLNLETGEIETNKNGKRVRYRTAVIAPCTTTAIRYWHGECGQVDMIYPPMKGPERTVEKIIDERLKEHQELIDRSMQSLCSLEEQLDRPLSLPPLDDHCPTAKKIMWQYQNNQTEASDQKRAQKAFQNIREDDIIPRDIFRLSVLVKFPEHIDIIIRHFEKNFPYYIKFNKRDDNQYKKTISQNPRFYFDRKKTAEVCIPNSDEKFFIEFQFKQKNMFYAHIRSHKAYEIYREALADFEKSHSLADKKRCNDAQKLCLDIHKNAVHQSNLYLLSEIAWADDNERTYIRPLTSNGQYLASQEMIERNYIVETYDAPFDGVTAFSTNNNEYLNKCCYLKLIGLLPENFDELGKYAKVHINKAWQTLTPADLNNFNIITEAAIRYQDIIRAKQQREKEKDDKIKNTHSKKTVDIISLAEGKGRK